MNIADRKLIVGISLIALLIIFALGWFLEWGWFVGLVEYVNEHGGGTFLVLVLLTAVSGFLAYIWKGKLVLLFIFAVVAVLLSLIVGGPIPVPGAA